MFMHHFQSGTFCKLIINPTLKLFIMPSEPLSNDHDSSASQDDDLKPHELSGDENADGEPEKSNTNTSKANLLLSVTTIMKTVIGAGILALPFTISRLGYLFGMLMFFIVILISQYSCEMLILSKNLSRHSNYSTIGYYIWRTKFSLLICSIAIVLINLGVCIVELTILKGALRKILVSYITNEEVINAFYTSPQFIVIVMAVLECPLTLARKIQMLKFFAFVGVSGIGVFSLALTICFFMKMSEPDRDWHCHPEMVPFADDAMKIILVVPNIMFALGFHSNFFPVFKGMKLSNDSKMRTTSLSGLIGCSFFYVIVGNMGYCLFGNNLESNFLLSFSKGQINEVLYIIMNVGFLLSVFCSFPILFFAARNNFIAITKLLLSICRPGTDTSLPILQEKKETVITDNDSSEPENEGEKSDRKKKRRRMFIIYTIALYLISIVIAVAVDDIGAVFNVLGSFPSNWIVFIFPNLFYVKLIQLKRKPKTKKYYISWFLILFFLPFGVFAVITNFL